MSIGGRVAPLRGTLPFCLGLILLAPLAGAASVTGSLDLANAPTAHGDARLSAEKALIDLSPAGLVSGFSLTWVAGDAQMTRREQSDLPGAQQASASRPENGSRALGAGRVASIACIGPCDVVAYLDAGEGGHVDVRDLASTRLGPRDASETHFAMQEEPGFPDAFYYEVPATWMELARAPAEGLVTATGVIHLFLWNATVDIETVDGRETIETGVWREPAAGPLGLPLGERVVRAFAILTLRGASLEVARGEEVSVAAPIAQLRLDGRLELPMATGSIIIDGATRALHGERVLLTGAFELSLSWEAARGTVLAGPAAPRAEAGLEGDASDILIGAEVVTRSDAVLVAVGATGLLAIALVAAFAVAPGPFVLLFSRITRSDVLDNPNRRHISELIHRTPGLNVSALSRTSGLAEVVVRHHLRVLEDCSVVIIRTMGRGRFAYPSEAAQWAGAAVVLSDPTRRNIATRVRSAALGLTQKELVSEMGLSQRLVSYHLHRLESAGLIRGEGERPRRYMPAPTLSEIATLDSHVAALN